MDLDTGTLVVVADGEKAMLLTNHGSPQNPKLRHYETETQDLEEDREIKTDRQHGVRSYGAGSADETDETDFKQQQKDRFARDLAERLNAALLEKDASVVVCAPPKTLGEIREALREDVRGKVIHEIDKDYTNHPLDEIAKLLARAEVPHGIPRTNSHDRRPD
ncbi:MAG: host attachment protein [Paracoccaceae bacterium]